MSQCRHMRWAKRAGRHLVATQEAPEPVGCQALGVVAVAGPAPQHRALHRCLHTALQLIQHTGAAASDGKVKSCNWRNASRPLKRIQVGSALVKHAATTAEPVSRLCTGSPVMVASYCVELKFQA